MVLSNVGFKPVGFKRWRYCKISGFMEYPIYTHMSINKCGCVINTFASFSIMIQSLCMDVL